MTSPHPEIATPPTRRSMVPVLVIGAGLLGIAGVAISAAAAHRGGGDLATTAGLFCLIHAAAALGGAAHLRAPAGSAPRSTTAARLGVAGVAALILGTALFAADLAVAGFAGLHPVPLAAPLGGFGMLAGWAALIVAAVLDLYD